MEFQGKNVLITGSTRGIGLETAAAFGKRGATVIVNGTTPESTGGAVEILRREGISAMGSVFDVSDEQAVYWEIRRITEEIGNIEILVNNAGISPKKNGRKVPLQDMDFTEWRRVVDVNLNGAFLCCRAVLPGMTEARWGKIVNIASAFGRGFTPMAPGHYTVTKAALLAFTKVLSGEVAPYGINCNAVAPGRAWTEMTKSQPKEVNDAFVALIPAGRFAEASEIAEAAVFLASEKADYCHGATLDINGGLCMV